MFETNQAFGLGKWLYWFVGLMAVYALLTMFPENETAVAIGGIFAVAGIGQIRHQIAKRNR